MRHTDFYDYVAQETAWRNRKRKEFVSQALDKLYTLEEKLGYKDLKLWRIINRLQKYLDEHK